MTDIESGSITATSVSGSQILTPNLSDLMLSNCFIHYFLISAGDAFSEEAERRFDKYPGQLNNQVS